MSPDGTLYRIEHTLPCSKFFRAHFAVRRWQDSGDSQAQEHEGHAVSTKTVRSHVTQELRSVTHSDKANNGLDRG